MYLNNYICECLHIILLIHVHLLLCTSYSHSKLAIVDESNLLLVYNMKKKEIVYQEPNATSVAWNASIEVTQMHTLLY